MSMEVYGKWGRVIELSFEGFSQYFNQRDYETKQTPGEGNMIFSSMN